MDCFFTTIKGPTIRGGGMGVLAFEFNILELGHPDLVEAWEEIFVLFRKQILNGFWGVLWAMVPK